MIRLKTVLFYNIFIILIIFLSGAVAADFSETQAELQDAIEAEIAAQKKADRWSQEKEQLISELRQARTRLEWVRYQDKKYSAYIENEKKTLAALKRKKAEMDRLRQGLEPFLDEIIANLAAFIETDLDFLSEERQMRLQFLRDSVNNFHLSMSEKLNRVLEALAVESEYGRSIEVIPEALNIEGKQIEAETLRIGRVALFYRSLNGHQIGRWNQREKSWEPLPSEFERMIRDTIEMASQQKSVELVDLPIGRAKK